MLTFLLAGALLGAPIKPVKEEPKAHWPTWRGNALGQGIGEAELPNELSERWAFKTKDMIAGAPAIVGDVIYVASMDRFLYAIDATTGKEIWKQKLGMMKGSPLVHEGKVSVGNIDGKVYCRDAKTGDAVWLFDNESGEIASGLNIHNGNVLVAAQGMPVTCLNAKGEKAWTFEIDGGSNGTPTVAGDVCFASGCDSHFHAIDAKTGAGLWKLELPGQAAATTCVKDDVAYIGTVTNQVVAIDLKTKEKLWQFETPKKAQPFHSSAAITDDVVILGSRDRKVYGLNRKTGKEIWNFVTEGAVDSSPVVVGTKVYVGCQSLTGEFYVLDAKTGKKLQELVLDSAVTGSVAVGKDYIVVGTEKGTLYCLGKAP
jgi:outer membrane protein assembly factor BamB